MAGKPKPMSQIKQLIPLYQRGEGKKVIARDLGLSKNTVKVYIAGWIYRTMLPPFIGKKLTLFGTYHSGTCCPPCSFER